MHIYEAVPFNHFAEAVRAKFEEIVNSGFPVVVMGVDNESLMQTYLGAFPEGTNKIFRERREYDCNCCLSFIRRIGAVAAVTPTGISTIWDVEIGGYYKVVTTAMNSLVQSAEPVRLFLTEESTAGGTPNVDNHSEVVWNHFYAPIPNQFVRTNEVIGTERAKVDSSLTVLLKGLNTFSEETLITVRELAASGSIYRGEEFLSAIDAMLGHVRSYKASTSKAARDFLIWCSVTHLQVSRFANSVIGTLVADLQEGTPLEAAVASYEQKVAPTNYRRTTAVVSPTMIQNARKELDALGMLDSVERRFASIDDINIGNALHVRQPQERDIFTMAELTTAPSAKHLAPATPVVMQNFLSNVLPSATSIELLFESRHSSNMVSLIAAKHPDAPSMFSWGNTSSWAYTGDTTDSIRERVKAAGGAVDGELVISLAWACSDDLDISFHTLNQNRRSGIYFSNRQVFGGVLDVDMNAGGIRDSEAPVENISFANLSRVPDGEYMVTVNNYNRRSSKSSAFTIRVQNQGEVTHIVYDRTLRDSEEVRMCHINISKGVATIKKIHELAVVGAVTSAKVWDLPTNFFVPVTLAINSPNHWEGNGTGNKHWFFILENCFNPSPVRGFFSEFLAPELVPHRRAFELLGNVAKTTEGAESQLSGVGFSSTNTFNFFARVKHGKTSKIYNVTN